MDYKIVHRLPTVAEYLRLRKSAGWWKTDEKATASALKNSLFCAVAIHHDTVAGTGRIIGDGLYLYIQDLIVHPEFQHKGIGSSLMSELMNYLKANTEPGTFIGLMAAKGLETYYGRFGFRARAPHAPGMYQVIGQP